MLTRRTILFTPFLFQSRQMVRIPGGRFRMGRDEDELLREFPNAGRGMRSMLSAESPAHMVSVPPFLLDVYEVTNRQFLEFMKSRPEWSKSGQSGDYLKHWSDDGHPDGEQDHPVRFITWDAAMAYAKWAGQRLPTEAEWEFAARGGMPDTKYPWGNEDPTPERVNFGRSELKTTTRVGSYPANGYGIHDLAGNVWEFCLDPWAPYSKDSAEGSGDAIRGMMAARVERRVIRGGSYEGGPLTYE